MKVGAVSCSYTKKEKSFSLAVMVANCYLPPWFRWVAGYICFSLFFCLFTVCLCYRLNDVNLVCHCLDFSVAPMMDWTDHHYRTLARLISKHAWLYTEMLAAETIVYQKGNLVSL